MTDQAFAQADPEWLKLIGEARDWLAGPLGQLLLEEEWRLLEDELVAQAFSRGFCGIRCLPGRLLRLINLGTVNDEGQQCTGPPQDYQGKQD